MMKDKTEFPWETEPNEVEGEAYGLPYCMRRNSFGAWCGYVGVPDTHPLYGKSGHEKLKVSDSILHREIDDLRISPIALFCADAEEAENNIIPLELCFDVHGGITWTEDHAGGPSHEGEGRWWFGFDCSHSKDLAPLLSKMPGCEYRNASYVEHECQELARQLSEWEAKNGR